MAYHDTVLRKEAVDGLQIKAAGTYVDLTFGGGGHSREIMSRLGEKGKLYAFDQDEDAEINTIDDDRFTLIQENFEFTKRYLKFYGITQVDGILADLGVSSHQFNVPERGFSTRFDAKLDMRMSKKHPLSAYQVINNYEEHMLYDIFRFYGELRNATAIAKTIVMARIKAPIRTTGQLKDIVKSLFPNFAIHKKLAQLYQAIRIEVNRETEALKLFLLQTPELIKKGGRISIISYHSLEDRLVKRFIRDGVFEGMPEKDMYGNSTLPFKKVGKLITPSEEEISLNNRARSAKLRIGERNT